MANYYCNTRSNYFRVKDNEKFKEFFKHVRGCEENPELWEEPQKDGSVMFGFGCYGCIAGVATPPIGRIDVAAPIKTVKPLRTNPFEISEEVDRTPRPGSYVYEEEIDIYDDADFEYYAKRAAQEGRPFSIVLYEDESGRVHDLSYDFYLLGPVPVSITEAAAPKWNLEDLDAEDYDFDAFLAGLQEHVADDDAVIIMEAGNEKLRYVTGHAVVVTSTDIDSVDLTELAIAKAGEMLKNLEYWTQCEY